jgi:hypothetical protein
MNLIELVLNPSNDCGKILSNCDANLQKQMAQSLSSLLRVQMDREVASTRKIAHMLEVSMWKLCSEPRDAIYTLLGVSKPINITLDYNMPIAKVYTRATGAIIQ